MLSSADYTFGERKFGGNAQAITKQRWLHHTSLLWDFDPHKMALLKHPQRIPDYRAVSYQSDVGQCFFGIFTLIAAVFVPQNPERSCNVQGREHLDFICRLKDFMTRAEVTEGIVDALRHAGIQAQPITLAEAEKALQREYVRNNRVLQLYNFDTI